MILIIYIQKAKIGILVSYIQHIFSKGVFSKGLIFTE